MRQERPGVWCLLDDLLHAGGGGLLLTERHLLNDMRAGRRGSLHNLHSGGRGGSAPHGKLLLSVGNLLH